MRMNPEINGLYIFCSKKINIILFSNYFMGDIRPNGQHNKNESKGNLRLIGIVVVVIIVVAVTGGYLGGLFGNHSSRTSPSTSSSSSGVTIITKGTEYQVSTGSYGFDQFSLSSAATVSGSFSSTIGITIYIMNPTQFSSFSTTGIASSYDFTTGHVPSGSINTHLPAGTYHIIFANDNGFNEVSTVTISTNLTATYSS